MYTTPVLPAPAIGGITLVAAPGPVPEALPYGVEATSPVVTVVLLAGLLVAATVVHLAVGLLVRRRAARTPRPRPVLRAAGWLVLAGLLAWALLPALVAGGIPSGWDLVGLLVAVLTLGYALLALRNVIPARRAALP